VSAPTGDHGGLRAAVEALAAEYDHYGRIAPPIMSSEVYHLIRDELREALAAHPVPEPTQDGEVGA
jgi:hypothetical protein